MSDLNIRAMRLITPSKDDPWSGCRPEGKRFTHEQCRTMAELDLNHRTVRTERVRLEYPSGSFSEPPTVVHVECPMLQRSRRNPKKVFVITPNGDRRWVTQP